MTYKGIAHVGYLAINFGFNPRAHKGRDPDGTPVTNVAAWFQSTRPQGARPCSVISSRPTIEFQSTRPQGARHHCDDDDFGHAVVSIHAPTRGATMLECGMQCRRSGFNPRAHKGRDGSVFSSMTPWYGFQSTRPQGARP